MVLKITYKFCLKVYLLKPKTLKQHKKNALFLNKCKHFNIKLKLNLV